MTIQFPIPHLVASAGVTSDGMMPGFGNHFSTEAIAGVLPIGRNSPQRVAHGFFAEQFSGTAFTAPRDESRRSWLYRRRPAALYSRFAPVDHAAFTPEARASRADPNRLRWDPLPWPEDEVDWLDGLVSYGGNGDPAAGTGINVYLYAASASMDARAFYSADGEFLIVPQEGRLTLRTELGRFDVAPQQIAVVPRGMRFAIDLPDGRARGYVCENQGAAFRLPDLGPIGANGLANPRDFLTPVAWFEEEQRPYVLVQKFCGTLWQTQLGHSPFDVVAWHGNLAPCRYDLRHFNTINTVSFDHPDPSIFTVLTSPSDTPGTANCDFVVFPPRWMVAEDTFRPPWFHRNIMSEFMGLIHGAYDAKEGGFLPGGASLHNAMSGHGPDRQSYEKALAAELTPTKIDGTMAFMFESRFPIIVADAAARAGHLQPDYDACWAGLGD